MKGHPRTFEKAHEARVLRLFERLHAWNALLQTHEALDYDDQDHQYLRDLKARIQKIRAQLKNMGEDLCWEQPKIKE